MVHTITPKDRNNRILVITLSNPFDMRTEVPRIMNELETMLGTITNTFYIIYDLRQVNIGFSDIVTGVSTSGIARAKSEFEKQLDEYAVISLVGAGTIVSVGAKTVSRFSPAVPGVFKTVEEAIEYARAELAKQEVAPGKAGERPRV